MFRSRFFRRLYLTYSLLVVLTAGVIGLLIQRQFQEDLVDQIGARLASVAVALHPVATEAFSDPDFDADPVFGEIGARAGLRLTLVAPSGLVLADSERDPASMENHAGRPEIREAMREGEGTSTRFSTTVRIRMMYHALRVDRRDRPLGVIRTSIPLARVDEQLTELRSQILQGTIIAILLALGLGVVVGRRFTAPVREMTAASEALRRGDYDVRVEASGNDELQVLGANLNRLAEELSQRVTSLTRQRAQLDTIIRSLQEGVVAVDEERRIVVSNRLGVDLLGLAPDEDPRLTAERLGHVDGLSELLDEIEEGADTARREIVVHRRAEDVILDAQAGRFEAEDERGIVVVFYDMTDLRRLERVRTDFVANVSHELKTPLTSIRGYVETLLDGAVHDPDNNVRFLDKIRQHVDRLSALVADLLHLARIESPAHELDIRVIDWREIVTDSVSRRRDPLEAKQLQLTVEPGNEPTWVEGDPEGMRQIIDNLLDNAISYTPEGGSITVAVQRRFGYGVVRISDTGIGIPDDAIPRIFERFYRVDRGRSRVLGGTGLGLSIVRNLLSRMNGHVSVRSEVGKGTTFSVGLPMVEEDPAASRPADAD